MKKIILILFLFSGVGFGQCTLTVKDFNLRGLTLNMPMSEVEKKYELLGKRDADTGLKIATVRFTDAYYYLHFMNGKLHAIHARYERKFNSDFDFLQALSKTLNLKTDDWKAIEYSHQMVCKDIKLEADSFKDSAVFSVTRILPDEPFKP